MRALRFIFWGSAGLIVYTQMAYPLVLGGIARLRGRKGAPEPTGPSRGAEPHVTIVIPAHREGEVIADKVANARRLDWPSDRLEVLVACDGSPDDTPVRAREAGADVVLELPWGGKVRAQDAGVRVADPRSTVIAFSDANSAWEPDALRALAARLEAEPRAGYVCGQVRFVNAEGGTNQEGLYWRMEMRTRELESLLASVTGGNGAIYAVRRRDYVEMDPVMGHDLSLPFTMVKHGRRAVYEPRATATEKMVPTIEGEFSRKRRMMGHAWAIVLRGGMLSPRGYPPLYGFMIVSHRVLRYVAPALHVMCLGTTAALVGRRRVYRAALAAQLALLAAAGLGGVIRLRPLLIARYYVLTNAAIVAGLHDHLRHGTAPGWAPPAGTR